MKSSLQYLPQSNCIILSHTCEDGNRVLKRNLVVLKIYCVDKAFINKRQIHFISRLHNNGHTGRVVDLK